MATVVTIEDRRQARAVAFAWLKYQDRSTPLLPSITNDMFKHVIDVVKGQGRLPNKDPYVLPYFVQLLVMASPSWTFLSSSRGSFGCVVVYNDSTAVKGRERKAIKLLKNRDRLGTSAGLSQTWEPFTYAELYVLASIQQLRLRYGAGQLLKVNGIDWAQWGHIQDDRSSLSTFGRSCLDRISGENLLSPVFGVRMDYLLPLSSHDINATMIRHTVRTMQILFDELDLVHCDLHEENIMKKPGGKVYTVIDFGLAQSIFGSSSPGDLVQRHFNGRADRLDVDIFFGYEWGSKEQPPGLNSPMHPHADMWSLGMGVLDHYYKATFDGETMSQTSLIADLFDRDSSRVSDDEANRWRLTVESHPPDRRNEYLRAMLRSMVVINAVVVPDAATHTQSFSSWLSSFRLSRSMSKGMGTTYFSLLRSRISRFPDHLRALEKASDAIRRKGQPTDNEHWRSFLWSSMNPLPVGRFVDWTQARGHPLIRPPSSSSK